ncbi:hypothetical protein JZ751_017512 [Albula glossodonta]|uniref:Uncharacterized protein n=1 Tax=Albula glossodonta TaxID=121402 RepID=A0A8T2PLH3_9TELE|nr:hypothetical protein JZ751_017512 [Albula glossodonta]
MRDSSLSHSQGRRRCKMKVMEGVLASTVTLGVCKTTCDFLFLPAVQVSLSSVSFCCCCLLIFTDLTVTAFLWLAEPWLPPFPVSNDIIALRFLLFLGHTYGAVLLLTIPLITMETACKLLLVPSKKSQVDREGPAGGECGGWKKGVEMGEGGRGTMEIGGREYVEIGRWWREGAKSTRGWAAVQLEINTQGSLEEESCFSPIPGFLCSLLAWALCGIWGGQGCWSEQLDVEVCIQRANSLSLCLPDLVTVTLSVGSDPALTLPALLLLLALPISLSMLRKGQAYGQTNPWTQQLVQEVRERTDSRLPQHKLPTHLSQTQHNVTAPAGTIIMEEASCRPTGHTQTADPQYCVHQATKTIPAVVHTHYPSMESNPNTSQESSAWLRSALRKCFTCKRCGQFCIASPQGLTYSPCRTLWARVLAGLLSAMALFVFPPSLTVNLILIVSVVSLAEWSLKH